MTVDIRSLQASAPDLERRFAAFKEKKLSLDMTRGKPCAEQLDLSNALLTILGPADFRAADGTDCRNYGGLDGLPEAKTLFAAFLGVAPDEVLVGDNSSLTLMHDTVARALSHGVPGGDGPWSRGAVKFLCPVPGYDRHFAICQHFGIEMLNVDMTDEGPDMDKVEQLAAGDAAIKGIWVVPQYGNPTGVTCSDRVVERLRADENRGEGFSHHLGQCLRASPPDRLSAPARRPARRVQKGRQRGAGPDLRLDLEGLVRGRRHGDDGRQQGEHRVDPRASFRSRRSAPTS